MVCENKDRYMLRFAIEKETMEQTMNQTGRRVIGDYVEALSSKAPVPGGGGVCALAGTLGASLGHMVYELTTGKKRYAAYEEELQEMAEQLRSLRDELLALADADEEVFFPLSQAYGLPTDTEEEQRIKAETMERCLKDAAGVPLAIAQKSRDLLQVLRRLAEIGSIIAISDVGVGAALAYSALKGGVLNVMINQKYMEDEEAKKALQVECDALTEAAGPLFEEIYAAVTDRIRG